MEYTLNEIIRLTAKIEKDGRLNQSNNKFRLYRNVEVKLIDSIKNTT